MSKVGKIRTYSLQHFGKGATINTEQFLAFLRKYEFSDKSISYLWKHSKPGNGFHTYFKRLGNGKFKII